MQLENQDLNAIIDQVRILKSNGLDWEDIEEQLTSIPEVAEIAREAVLIVKKEKRTKNRSVGMVLIMIGSFLCFCSMVYTFFYGYNVFMLYGLTLIGVGFAFAGLVYVMG